MLSPSKLCGNRTLLSDRVVYSTDTMIPFRRAVLDMQDPLLKDHVKEARVGEDAARLVPEVDDRLTAL